MGVEQIGEAVAKRSVVYRGEVEGDGPVFAGDGAAVGGWDTLQQPVETESSEFVGQPPLGHVVGIDAE